MARPVRASALLDTFGVNTHINYTDGQYADLDLDLRALRYLGIDHVRDASPNPESDPYGQTHLFEAAASGLKFVFGAQRDFDPATVVARLHEIEARSPGSVQVIEGPNEVNNWPVTYKGMTGTAAAQAYMVDLYAAVKADPLLKDVPVSGFTDYPAHAGKSDWITLHPYPKDGDQPRGALEDDLRVVSGVDPGKPFISTETGYHTAVGVKIGGGWEGVDEATQAKFALNTYMDNALLGSKGTYLYQLLDAYKGVSQEEHFGLFRLDGSAKPAATAIRNFTAILADTDAAAALTDLEYSVQGLPASGRTYLSQKADGSHQVIVWAEPDVWDEDADRAVAAPVASTTVGLSASHALVEVFDPLVGDAPVMTFRDVSSVTVLVTDHPLVIQVSAALTAVPEPIPDPEPVPVPSDPVPPAPPVPPAEPEPPVVPPPVVVPPVVVPPVVVPDPAPLPPPEGTGGDMPTPVRRTVEGGPGHDAVASEGVRRGAVFGYDPATGTVSETRDGGADLYRGVEEIRYADGRMVFDPQDHAAQVVRLYQAALGRDAEQAGLNGWIAELDRGASLDGVSAAFVASAEFQARFPEASTTEGFVTLLYAHALGRAPDAGGFAGWTSALDAGAVTRAQALTGFSESAEHVALTAPLVQAGIWDRDEYAAAAARLYDTVLGRLPEEAGLSGHAAALHAGRSLHDVADVFVASPEFAARYGLLDDRGFVETLYRNSLHREGEASGVEGHVASLAGGASRTDVVLAFSESAEHVALTAPLFQSDVPQDYGIQFL